MSEMTSNSRRKAVTFVIKNSSDNDDAPAKYRVCRICLAIDTEMKDIKENTLFEAYETLTGLKIEEDSLPQKVCCECAELLTASYQFRNKALLANNLMLQALRGKTYISIRDVKSINSPQNKFTNEWIVQNDEYIEFNNDTQSDLEETEDVNPYLKEAILVKGDIDSDVDEEKVFTDNNINAADEIIEVADSDIEKVEDGNSCATPIEDDAEVETYLKQFCDIIYSDDESNVREQNELNLDAYMSVTKLTVQGQIDEINKRKDTVKYKEAEHKCDTCSKIFQFKKLLDIHMIRHSDVCGPYECHICKLRMKTKEKLTRHIGSQHSNQYSCRKCAFKTKHRVKAKDHIKWHQGTTYECKICNKVYEYQSTLNSHRRNCHSNVICALCGHSFVNNKGLLSHKQKTHFHDNTEEELVGPYCETCDVKFLDEEAYLMHFRLNSQHSEDERIKARKKWLSLPSAPRNLKKTSSGHQMLSCELCGMQLRTMQGYGRHFKLRHPGESRRNKATTTAAQFMCEQCGKICISKTILNDHMGVHSGKKSHRCDQCDKSFYTLVSLTLHKKIHLKDRRTYKCSECEQIYVTNSGLDKHKRVKHSDTVRVFCCEDCGKTFKYQEGLYIHNKHVHKNIPWPKRNRNRKRVNTGSTQ